MDLEMNRGDTRSVVFTFAGDTTFTGSDVVRFTVKHRHSDADTDAVVSRTSTDGGVTIDGATATATINPEDTEAFTRSRVLVYDWQLSAAGATHTLDKGRIIVSLDVTQTRP